MMRERKTLLVDADDTLWENNIYFQEAMANFLTIMEGLGFSPREIGKALSDLERENIKIRGYGSHKFIISMKETFLRHCGPEDPFCAVSSTDTLTVAAAGADVDMLAEAQERVCQTHCGERGVECLVQRIESIGLSIRHRPLVLLPGVEETLPSLSARHSLILFTKGDPTEQMDKVERSGLAPYFNAVEIAREKNREAYLALVEKHGLVKEQTWMIGNSPRSDINPATLAGLRAVFIPHPCTWELEEEPILRPEQVTVLRSFAELLTLF